VTLEEQQASSRRLAALVAATLGAKRVRIYRRHPDGSVTVAGEWGDDAPVDVAAGIEAPIVVDDKPWGHIGVAAADDIHERIATRSRA
jgi:hypothetical protein